MALVALGLAMAAGRFGSRARLAAIALQYFCTALRLTCPSSSKLVPNADAEIADRRSRPGIRRVCRGVYEPQSCKVGVSVFYSSENRIGDRIRPGASSPTDLAPVVTKGAAPIRAKAVEGSCRRARQ